MEQSVSPRHIFLTSQKPFLEIRKTFDSALPYAQHFHSCFSFGLILKGRTRMTLGTETYIVEKGDMVFIDANQVHSCNPIEHDTRSYYMVFIDVNWLYQHVLSPLCGARAQVLQPVLKRSPLFAEALSLLSQPTDITDETYKGLEEIFVKIQKKHHCFTSACSPQTDTPVPFFQQPSMDALHEEHCRVADLAHTAGVCRESFSRSFRKACALPPSNYLHCLRLEHGKALLQEGKTIAEAAVASGYVDQSHFHRMFVKFFSVTPGCYKKKNASAPTDHIRTRNSS